MLLEKKDFLSEFKYMLLAAFKLSRDKPTEKYNFGYKRPLWPGNTRPYQHYAPTLGCPIEIETKITTNLVKMIELYRFDDVVIAERLTWMIGTDLYPFRVRHIRVNKLYEDEPLLFLPNMGTIHRIHTGLGVSLTSPLRFYIDTINFHYQMEPDTHRYLEYLLNHFSLDGVVSQETEACALRNILSLLDENYIHGIESFISSGITTTDPISQNFFNKRMKARNLIYSSKGDNPFDTSPPLPIEITHPDVTKYSPREYHEIAKTFELLTRHFTDVKFRYILSLDNRTVLDHQVYYLVSRYPNSNEDIAKHYMFAIIQQIASIEIPEHPGWISITRNIVICIEASYGEEVIIEIYTENEKTCLLAIHLDLAMIALCSSGVIATST